MTESVEYLIICRLLVGGDANRAEYETFAARSFVIVRSWIFERRLSCGLKSPVKTPQIPPFEK